MQQALDVIDCGAMALAPRVVRCQAGHIEYWSPSSFRFPDDGVAFRSKLDTDLYTLAKARAIACSLDVSRDGSQFVVFSSDRCAMRAYGVKSLCNHAWLG